MQTAQVGITYKSVKNSTLTDTFKDVDSTNFESQDEVKSLVDKIVKIKDVAETTKYSFLKGDVWDYEAA